MKILKFGGTSVGEPERMKKVAEIVLNTEGKKVVVLSALSGTTNSLVKIGEHRFADNLPEAKKEIAKLESHYHKFVSGLFVSEEFKSVGSGIVKKYMSHLTDLVEQKFDNDTYREVLAQGEMASTEFFYSYLKEIQINSLLLNAIDFMFIDENKEPVIEKISDFFDGIIPKINSCDIILTQGYICKNHQHKIDNLKRGGSDYTASLIGAAIKAEEIQIWTDIDGMHNNDPRVVNNTVPVAELTFDEASELAYFGAKILHPSTIVPAQKFGIPVRLKNTMDEKSFGTLISNKGSRGKFKAVAFKDNIVAIKIKSSRMLLAYGFLTKIFEVFEKHKTPIDMIATSEIAVSLTIDNEYYLEEITEELKNLGAIEVDKNQSIICIVGNMLTENKTALSQVFSSIAEIPVRMVSYGGSNNNISLLVGNENKDKTLKLLNRGLFGLNE